MSLKDKLKEAQVNQPTRPATPVWKGPEEDGVTFSLLSRWLVCRERFRLLVVEGLKPHDQFNHRIEYGSMWHVCEEALAGRDLQGRSTDGQVISAGGEGNWETLLKEYVHGLCRKYPLSQEQIQHWYEVCRTQFPHYVRYWSMHPDVLQRTPLMQEQTFNVPYSLPSGRTVHLRGKFDSVDLIGQGRDAGVYLQENKSKGDINEEQLKRQLSSGFDLQTLLYLVALQEAVKGGKILA